MKTVDDFRFWIEHQLAELSEFPCEDWREYYWYEAKDILRDAYEHATKLGLPQAAIVADGGAARPKLCELLAALPEPSYLTKGQLANALKISPRTVERRIYQGSIPEPLKIGRRVVWSVKELRDYGINL